MVHLLFRSKTQSWDLSKKKKKNLLMYLHSTRLEVWNLHNRAYMRSVWGWKWDRLHMLAVYAIQPRVQIQHLHLMHLTPRELSLCLARFKVMTETNRLITTDLSSPVWWLDIMQILNTCKHSTLKTHLLLIQTWIQCNGIILLGRYTFSCVHRVCFNHPANHPIFYNPSLRWKK